MARPGFILIAGLVILAIAGGAPVAAQETRVRITKADCSWLVKYTASPDVAYQPGVDAHGRSVVSADIEDSAALQVMEFLMVSIEVDLAERLGIPPGPSNFDADAEVGMVEVRDGRAYLNGRPLRSESQAALAGLCQQAVGRDS